MNESAESRQGTHRRLTPVEVGMIVRLYRNSRELKRIALAAEAHVSEKTLEWLEAGVLVREDSYRRVAAAIGLREDAFIKEEYIPTPSEYLERQEKAKAEFQKNHTKVLLHGSLIRVSCWMFSAPTPALLMITKSLLNTWSWSRHSRKTFATGVERA